ncbi:hypothetical protein [Mycobacterium aquaticum]|nr:hypothetical protein [Mycobacterium aquaticum]
MTLKPAPTQLAECGPDQLARCVPRLADIEPDLFDMVTVYGPISDFAVLPPSSAREDAPPECRSLPNLGARPDSELDVAYRPAPASGNRFPANNGDDFHVRFMVAGTGADMTAQMNEWADHCRMWGIAATMNDNGIQAWLIAESADVLQKFQAGDVDQWPFVTHMAATELPNGVMVQAFYRTTDLSATSPNDVFSEILRSAGRPRPRSALPPSLTDWSRAQISSLLPPLDVGVSIDAQASRSDGRWLLCPQAEHAPLYDPQASWHRPTNPAVTDKTLPPAVAISRALPGTAALAEVRREIATCTAHLTDIPALCSGHDMHQTLDTDSAVADGEETIRITQRWLRVENVQGYDRCAEGTDALRITHVRGLIVISSADAAVVKGTLGDPALPTSSLDQLQAQTVHAIKTA